MSGFLRNCINLSPLKPLIELFNVGLLKKGFLAYTKKCLKPMNNKTICIPTLWKLFYPSMVK
jgi:hypothetical protein